MRIKLDSKQFKCLKLKLEQDLEKLRYSVKSEFQDLKRAISKGDWHIAICSCEELIESFKEIEVKENTLEDLEEMEVKEE